MPLSNLPTGTVSEPEERRVRGVEPARARSAGQRGPAEGRVEQLEAELEAVRAERNRLQEERAEIVARYEQLLKRERRGVGGPDPVASQGDSLRLQLARYLGIR